MTNTNINNVNETSVNNALVVLGNPNNLIVPETPKDCPQFIAICDGIIKTAKNMLKQHNQQDEQYKAIMRLSWQYAIWRLQAQYNLGKYFSEIVGAQGMRNDIINSDETKLSSPDEKKLTKEQIIKQQYNISTKSAWQHEQLYKHNDLMNKTIKKAKADDDLPTLRLAMTILKEESDKISNEYKEKQKNR